VSARARVSDDGRVALVCPYNRMLNVFGMPATVRVHVAVPPADLRKGYDSLSDSIDGMHCIKILILEGVSARCILNEDARTLGGTQKTTTPSGLGP
jgi:hypothetical protein